MKAKSVQSFEKEVKRLARKYPSLSKDLEKLIDILEIEPFTGTPLGRNCYKIRLAIASKSRGKSGGGRVVTCVKIVDDIVYLLTIYDKSEKEDLADKELGELLKAAGLGGDK